jgi:hypothetical protein
VEGIIGIYTLYRCNKTYVRRHNMVHIPPGTTTPHVEQLGIVWETLDATSNALSAVCGVSELAASPGVWGQNQQAGVGVSGSSASGDGVFGSSASGNGVHAKSAGASGSAVLGENTGGGRGVVGLGTTSTGVFGQSNSGTGVMGISISQWGVAGQSTTGDGIYGQTLGTGNAGHFAGKVRVEGDVEITGNLNMINSASDIILSDCAEDFDISAADIVEPGTVMVIDRQGALRQSEQAYDKRVAGVISGAGDYRPGITLGKQQSGNNRMPVALLGKVYCKVDARCSPIEVGDLLTTSPTPGHAMAANDPLRAFGAVIGKALRPLAQGRGLIPILIALQ